MRLTGFRNGPELRLGAYSRMKRWKHTLLLTDLWEQWEEGDLDIEELAMATARRIEVVMLEIGESDPEIDRLDTIRMNFEMVTDKEDYNYNMNDLYSWGDYDKTLWIETQEHDVQV